MRHSRRRRWPGRATARAGCRRWTGDSEDVEHHPIGGGRDMSAADQKVWFITGAGSGIGAGTARAAVEAGYRVVATGRNLERLRNGLSDVAGDSLMFERLDVTDEGEAKRVVDAAAERFGRIDILVNNAGYSLLGNFEEMTIDQIE